jgi:hypothetical protein
MASRDWDPSVQAGRYRRELPEARLFGEGAAQMRFTPKRLTVLNATKPSRLPMERLTGK